MAKLENNQKIPLKPLRFRDGSQSHIPSITDKDEEPIIDNLLTAELWKSDEYLSVRCALQKPHNKYTTVKGEQNRIELENTVVAVATANSPVVLAMRMDMLMWNLMGTPCTQLIKHPVLYVLLRISVSYSSVSQKKRPTSSCRN